MPSNRPVGSLFLTVDNILSSKVFANVLKKIQLKIRTVMMVLLNCVLPASVCDTRGKEL